MDENTNQQNVQDESKVDANPSGELADEELDEIAGGPTAVE